MPQPDPQRVATPPSAEPAMFMRPDRWLGRFATSFFVVAVVLVWEGWKAFQRNASDWHPLVEWFAAAASLSMGVLGVRARHRLNRRNEVENPTK